MEQIITLQKTRRDAVYFWFLGGFISPPLIWLFLIWFTNCFNVAELLKIVGNPVLAIYVIGYVTGVTFLLKRKLSLIETYVNERNYKLAQKEIYSVPILFIVAQLIYSLIGPNTGLVGLGFDTNIYFMAWLFGLTVIVLFSIPFFILSLTAVEKWTMGVPIIGSKSTFRFSHRMYTTIIFSCIGVVFTAGLSFYALVINNLAGNELLISTSVLLSKGLIVAVISLLSVLFPQLLICTKISNQIIKLKDIAKTISIGDLTTNVKVEERDELGVLSQALDQTIMRFRNIITNIKSSADYLAQTSQQLSQSSQQISQGAAEQASSTEEVSSSMEEMLANIAQNTDNSRQTENLSSEASSKLTQANTSTSTAVKSMQDIAGKVSVISEIAEKTDLLAINAAIEAARAGEHGKGFAVVASEVRKLAEHSKKAAIEINEIMGNGVIVAVRAGEELNDLVGDIHKTVALIREISAASAEQNAGAEQINTAVQQLNTVTQQNSASSEELATSAEEVASQAGQLKDSIAFFRVTKSEVKSKINDLSHQAENLLEAIKILQNDEKNGNGSGNHDELSLELATNIIHIKKEQKNENTTKGVNINMTKEGLPEEKEIDSDYEKY